MNVQTVTNEARRMLDKVDIVVDMDAFFKHINGKTKSVPTEFERAVVWGVLAELLKRDKPRTAAAYRGHMTRAVHRIIGV